MVTAAGRPRRLLSLLGLVVLLAGPLIAPDLPPVWTIPVSAVWLGVAASMTSALVRWSRRRFGWIVPAGLVLAGAGVVMVAGHDWSGPLGTRMPCRRNWSWLPSYLLRSSPTESVSFEVGGIAVKVCYGSPRARGRKMLGGTLVPFGQLWRTGANEPTTIRAAGPISVAGVRVDGKASLYSVPGPETWEIVLNRSTSQWGIESEYSGVRAGEIGRTVVASSSTTAHQEALSFTAAAPAGADTVDLMLSWEHTRVRIPVAPAPR